MLLLFAAWPTPQTLEEQLKRLVQVVDCVCADVQRAQNIYNKLFYRWVSLFDTPHQQCANVALLIWRMPLHPPQCGESRFPQLVVQAVGETGTPLKNAATSPCEQVMEQERYSNAVIFFRPPGSWWCQRGDGAGLRDSGAGELQTDSDDGRDHLRALHVPENPQRLSGVPSSQVGDQFDSNDFSYIRQRESLWLSDLKCQRGDETLLTFPSALH